MNIHNHDSLGLNGRTIVTERVVYRMHYDGRSEVLHDDSGDWDAQHELPPNVGLPGYHYHPDWPITFVDSAGDVMRWTGERLELINV